MLAWLNANIGTIIISLVFPAVAVTAITVIRKDKKKYKSTCGGNFGHYPMSGSCHSH